MADVKITDLVPQETIDKIKELNAEMQNTLTTYTAVARELAKGIDIQVKGLDDLEKMQNLLNQKSKEAATSTEQLNRVVAETRDVLGRTTAVVAESLQNQNKLNREVRQSKVDYVGVMGAVEKVTGAYEQQLARMIEIDAETKKNKKTMSDYQKLIDDGKDKTGQYAVKILQLTATNRQLAQEKAKLNSLLKAEEKELAAASGSYDELSQQLEILKKSYKSLSAEQRESEQGKGLLETINQLDTELKHMAENMDEHQRNVGDYAIALSQGSMTVQEFNNVLGMNCTTMNDVIEQNKQLEDARRRLNSADANYDGALAAINNQLEENKRKLADVSDIMDRQAKSVAEAEEQNKRLHEALKLVDLTSEDAQTKIEALNAKIAENDKIIQENTTSQTSLKKNLKELVLEIANLSIQYSGLSEEEQKSAEGQALKEHMNELIEKAGELKDAIADTNQAISNAASDTRTFDQVSEGLQLAIDGFGLATGAAEILGISEGELAEIQTKLQAAIAASNAMQSIQNALQSQSALMQGVMLVQTRLRTVAENLHTAAQGRGTVATAALTAAQWAFNAAANANPIGLVVVAITACIAAVWGLVKAFQAFFGPSEEALKNYQDQKKALEDMCDANDKLIDRMKARGATEAELLNQSLTNKEAEKKAADALFEQAKELYDEDEDEYKESLEAKKKADEEFEKHKEDSLNYLLRVIHESEEEEKKQRLGTYEYKRQLIQAELEQQKAIAASLLAQEKITRQVYENLCASLEKAAQLKVENVNAEEEKANNHNTGGNRVGSSRVSIGNDDIQKAIDELNKAIRAGEDGVILLIEDSMERQRQSEIQSYRRRVEDLNAEYEKRRKLLAKDKDGFRQLELAHERELQGLATEHNRKLESLEMSRMERVNDAEAQYIASHLAAVEKGSKDELDWRLKELDNQKQAELLAICRSEDEKTITIDQANEMRANLVLKYAKMEKDVREDYFDGLVRKAQDSYAAEAVIADNAYNQELNKLNAKYAEELKAAGDNEKRREEVTRKHEENVARLTETYARQRAQVSIDSLEELLKTEGLSAEERAQLEEQLAKAKIEYEKAVTDAVIAENERQVKSDTDAAKKRMENAQRWLQVASESLNAINDLASAIYDAKIERVEAEQEANEAAGDAEQERIANLVEQNVITEEEGEARKRAAEAKTAKKNEELEKKKQQLQYKQAVWDKANSLAQAGIATALAITKALPNIVLAALAGAMGAVQIATILATPIPKYAKGTKSHDGGLAIVGDGGRREVVIMNGSAWLTPDRPTLVDMPKGAEVIPNVPLYENLVNVNTLPAVSDTQIVVSGYNDRNIIRGVENLASLVRQQMKQRQSIAYHQNFELFKASKGL